MEIDSRPLADQIEEKILDYIKKENLVPGDTLPNEARFTEMFGVSRNVVREAMSRLRMLGILQSRTKRGIVITEPKPLIGFQRTLAPKLLSEKTIKNLMGMRFALEIGMTDFIFSKLQEKDIDDLQQILEREHLLGLNYRSIESEQEFHQRIHQIAGNDFIDQLQSIMYPVFSFVKTHYEEYWRPINENLDKSNSIVTHRDIFKCLKESDAESYRLAIKAHLAPYWEFIQQENENDN